MVSLHQLIKKKRSPVKLIRQKKRRDFWLFVLPVLFCLFGLLMIYEASNITAFREFGDKYKFVKDQLTWFVIGFILMIISSFISYKRYYSLSFPLMIFTIVILLAIFIPNLGIKTLGAKRWLNLGFIRFQPSELSKLTVILYLSSWFGEKEKNRFFAFLFLMLIIVGLVIIQPDLGTAVILASIFTTLYFFSGASIWHFLILVPLIVTGIILLAITSAYRMARVLAFINPNIDPLGMSYHIKQILISLGSGGLWGIGLGGSKQKYQFLPEATTDSIFAIIAEEFGFIGGCTLITLFFIFFYRIFLVMKNAPSQQARLLTAGIWMLFCSQTLINLGAMVALFPLTGVPLPFISYGGSNLIISLVAVGIVINISRQIVSSD